MNEVIGTQNFKINLIFSILETYLFNTHDHVKIGATYQLRRNLVKQQILYAV